MTFFVLSIVNFTHDLNDSTIKNCSGFVSVNGYYIDTMTGTCYMSSHPIDCTKISRALPSEVKQCIEKNGK